MSDKVQPPQHIVSAANVVSYQSRRFLLGSDQLWWVNLELNQSLGAVSYQQTLLTIQDWTTRPAKTDLICEKTLCLQIQLIIILLSNQSWCSSAGRGIKSLNFDKRRVNGEYFRIKYPWCSKDSRSSQAIVFQISIMMSKAQIDLRHSSLFRVKFLPNYKET